MKCSGSNTSYEKLWKICIRFSDFCTFGKETVILKSFYNEYSDVNEFATATIPRGLAPSLHPGPVMCALLAYCAPNHIRSGQAELRVSGQNYSGKSHLRFGGRKRPLVCCRSFTHANIWQCMYIHFPVVQRILAELSTSVRP